MVVTCEVEYDNNPEGSYYSGQCVNGKIILKCDKIKEVKGILLTINGFAKTIWSERRFGRTHFYSGREDYLTSRTYLMGSDNTQKCRIESGEHTFNFSCNLPYHCPSSFEGCYGHIRYSVEVCLIRPWKFDQTYKRAFTVLKLLDLNHGPLDFSQPSNTESYKIFCCGPLKMDPLKIQVNIPQTGYVAGQSIAITALITNNSNLKVHEVKFGLIMLVRYFSTPSNHARVERISVTKAKRDSISKNASRSVTVELLVPQTPPSCINDCGILQIAYQIEVECIMPGFNANQVVVLPITIGNVPLSSSGIIQQQPICINNQCLHDNMSAEQKIEHND